MTEEAKKEVAVPEKFKKLVEDIEKLSVLDLAELVKVLEDKFGVSAAAPVAVAAAPGAAPAEEKTEFTIELKALGDKKVAVIKAIKELTGKGLKEASDLAKDGSKILENVSKEKSDEAKKKLEEAGAKVEVK